MRFLVNFCAPVVPAPTLGRLTSHLPNTAKRNIPRFYVLARFLHLICVTLVSIEFIGGANASSDEAIAPATDDTVTRTKSDNTVLGFFQPNSSSGYTTLILYALFLCILGWTALLYPFFFVPKFRETCNGYVAIATETRGKIIHMKRSQMFNPLRAVVPTQYNCYITVEYVAPATAQQIVKELNVDSEAFQELLKWNRSDIRVFTLPEYPQSGLLEPEYQAVELSTNSKAGFAAGGLFLLGTGIWTSMGTTSNLLYSSEGWWKFWLVLTAGHGSSFGLAFWICHFVYRNRVEALLYGTSDDLRDCEYEQKKQVDHTCQSQQGVEGGGLVVQKEMSSDVFTRDNESQYRAMDAWAG